MTLRDADRERQAAEARRERDRLVAGGMHPARAERLAAWVVSDRGRASVRPSGATAPLFGGGGGRDVHEVGNLF